MKYSPLLIIVLLALSAINTMGYVVIYPGVTFYGDNLTIEFKNSMNFSYVEVGTGYFYANNSNISTDDTVTINISAFGEGYNCSDVLMHFNTSTSATFTYTQSYHTALMFDISDDGTTTYDNVGNQTISFTANGDIRITVAGILPHAPYDGNSTYYPDLNALNLTWTGGNYSDAYIVEVDGVEIQNSTALYYNDTSVFSSGTYVIWGWNDTCDGFRSSTGLTIGWGVVGLSCYNESNPTQSIQFDIEISNSDLSTTYTASDLISPAYISFDDIPFGDDTIFIVSNDTYYEQRIYTYDLVENFFYNYTFYLPVKTPTGGETNPSYNPNTSYAENYVLKVVGPLGDYGYEEPIEDATIQVKKYTNVTDSYENMSVVVTDADGETPISLYPGDRYAAVISKSGYITETTTFIPPVIEFAEDREIKFRINPISVTEDEFDIFWDNINFTGVMTGIGYGIPGNITITYLDINGSTISTFIVLYYLYNGSSSLLDHDLRLFDNDFSNTISGINTSRTHKAILFFSNTANFEVSSPVTITINPIFAFDPAGNNTQLEERIESIVGPLNLGWLNVLSIIVPIIVLGMFGPYNTGMGIFGCGFSLLLMQVIFNMKIASAFNPALALISFLIIAIGIIYMWTKKPEAHI